MITNELKHELLMMFVSDESGRKKLQNPLYNGELTFATDSYRMLCFPKFGTYEASELTVEKFISIDGENINIDKETLRNILETFPKEKKIITVECPQCDWEGTTECYHCNQDMECEKCKWDGEIEDFSKTEFTEILSHEQWYVGILWIAVNPQYLLDILIVSEKLNTPIVCKIKDKSNWIVFFIWEAIALIMPVTSDTFFAIYQ